jgi:CMP-N-acetylneuraminic acid synthetase
MEFVIEHARKTIKEDYIILLQVTSPTRDLKRCQAIIDKHQEIQKGPIKSLVTVNKFTLKPDGYLYIFPRDVYIWNTPLFVVLNEVEPDIDWIWDFRIAEAMLFGNHS